MKTAKDAMLQRVADLFLDHKQPLAAAIAYAEVAGEHPLNPDLWFGLGTALSRCTGRLAQKPFLEWSARCLKRTLLTSVDSETEEQCQEWLMDLSATITVDAQPAMEISDLHALLAFLDIDINIFPNAISAMPENDHGFIIMTLGDQGKARFLPAILSALRGVWGEFNVRAALKRLGNYGDSPEIRETLEILAFSTKSDRFQPYLRVALDRIDPEWAYDLLHDAAQAREEMAEGAYPNEGDSRPWWKFWER